MKKFSVIKFKESQCERASVTSQPASQTESKRDTGRYTLR